MCRSDIEDSFFSKTYFDVLPIVQVQGMLKMLNIDKKAFHPTLVRLKKDIRNNAPGLQNLGVDKV
jgi:hypothetical protein